MNRVALEGTVLSKPEVTTLEGNLKFARFILETERDYQEEPGQPDWISCFTVGKKAEYVKERIRAGDTVQIIGHIQTWGYYDPDTLTYGAEVFAEELDRRGKAGERPGLEEVMELLDKVEDWRPPLNEDELPFA